MPRGMEWSGISPVRHSRTTPLCPSICPTPLRRQSARRRRDGQWLRSKWVNLEEGEFSIVEEDCLVRVEILPRTNLRFWHGLALYNSNKPPSFWLGPEYVEIDNGTGPRRIGREELGRQVDRLHFGLHELVVDEDFWDLPATVRVPQIVEPPTERQ